MRAVEHRHAGLGQAQRERVVAQLRVVGDERDGLVGRGRGRDRRLGEAVAQVVVVADVGGRTRRAPHRRRRAARGSRPRTCRRSRRPCPRHRADCSARGPDRAARRSRAASSRRCAANGTPARSARSMIISHSPPESWIETSAPGGGAAAGREEQQRARELVQRLDAHDAVAVEQRLVGEVAAGHRAGVRERRRGRRLGAPDLERDDRNAALGGLVERRAKPRRDRARFRGRGRSPSPPAARPRSRCSRRPWSSAPGPARSASAKRKPRIVVRERAEDAAGMRDERDRAGPRLARAREAADPDAVEIVVEPHAVGAADRHARRARHRGEPLASGGVRSPPRKPEAKITAARAPTAIASPSVSSSRSLRTDSTARSGGCRQIGEARRRTDSPRSSS